MQPTAILNKKGKNLISVETNKRLEMTLMKMVVQSV